jgi:ABC-type phosphate/phosphonate transport system permease subunit
MAGTCSLKGDGSNWPLKLGRNIQTEGVSSFVGAGGIGHDLAASRAFVGWMAAQ